jgi:hypothetical protein
MRLVAFHPSLTACEAGAELVACNLASSSIEAAIVSTSLVHRGYSRLPHGANRNANSTHQPVEARNPRDLDGMMCRQCHAVCSHRADHDGLKMGVESGWSKRGVVTNPARSRRPCRYLGSYLPPSARSYKSLTPMLAGTTHVHNMLVNLISVPGR